MKKDDLPQYHDDTNLSLKRKLNEEVLEISSTGYGLEPVSEKVDEEPNPIKTYNRKNPSKYKKINMP